MKQISKKKAILDRLAREGRVTKLDSPEFFREVREMNRRLKPGFFFPGNSYIAE